LSLEMSLDMYVYMCLYPTNYSTNYEHVKISFYFNILQPKKLLTTHL
jgi:hypothetical protein